MKERTEEQLYLIFIKRNKLSLYNNHGIDLRNALTFKVFLSSVSCSIMCYEISEAWGINTLIEWLSKKLK